MDPHLCTHSLTPHQAVISNPQLDDRQVLPTYYVTSLSQRSRLKVCLALFCQRRERGEAPKAMLLLTAPRILKAKLVLFMALPSSNTPVHMSSDHAHIHTHFLPDTIYTHVDPPT